jgi:hypothetical protein
MTSILILSVAALGMLIGWYSREIKIYIDARRREDNIMRIIQDRLERKEANQ